MHSESGEKMSNLTQVIEQAFGWSILNLETIKQMEASSYVAKIVTADGKMYVVKSLFIPKDRQQFIVETEKLLREKGVKLASPVPSRENRFFFEYKGAPFVIYEWVQGKNQRLKNRQDLQSVAKTLGHFHRSSIGLIYPKDTKIYSHTDWIKDYKQRLKVIKSWKEKYKRNPDPKYRVIVEHISFFDKMGKLALKKLKASSYQKLVSEPFRKQSLVHGDFHQRNIIVRGKEKFLIDFEDVRYDFPSKDLQRIFEMHLRSHQFNKKDFRGMLKKYEEANPLPKKVKKVVLIDFLFPHIFERNLRQNKYAEMPLAKVINRIGQERKKIQHIYEHYFRKK